jgi:hypothetical protein
MHYEDSVDFAGMLDGHTEVKPYTPTEADRRLVQKRDDFYKWFEESRSPYEIMWEQNRRYIKGDQLWVRNHFTGEVRMLNMEDSKRLRSVNNVLRPAERSLVAKLAKLIPGASAAPCSEDFDELHAARAEDAFIRYFRNKEALDVKYISVCRFLVTTGTGFLELYWDTTKGAEIFVCKVCKYEERNKEMENSPCPRCTQQRDDELAIQQADFDTAKIEQAEQVLGAVAPGQEPPPEMLPDVEMPPITQLGPLPPDQEAPNLTTVNEGDICARVVDPRWVYVPPGVRHIKDCPLVFIKEPMLTAVARAKYPEMAAFIQDDTSVTLTPGEATSYSEMNTDGHGVFLRDYVWHWTAYELPTPAYRNGRCLYYVGDILVKEGELPLPWLRRQPMYMFRLDVNEGEFWGESPVTQAWHRQRELNNNETQMREYGELVTHPKIMNPIGSRVQAEEITAVTEQVITYNATAGELTPLQFPPLPQSIPLRRDQLTMDIRSQFGITEAEAGLMGSDPNGRAAAIVNAEADAQVGPTTRCNNEEWRELYVGAIRTIRKKYKKDRKWIVVGPEGTQTYSFDEIDGDSERDVIIEQDDGLANNPAIRLQQVIGLAQLGFFMGPQGFDKKAFSRMAKLKWPGQGYEPEAIERAAASRIPFLLRDGKQYLPQMWDNPLIFADELKNWLAGPGRLHPDWAQLVMPVFQYYEFWAVSGQMPNMGVGPAGAPQDPTNTSGPQGPSQGPGAGPGGPDQSANGGTPNNPGNLGTGRPQGSIQEQAQSTVSAADQMGEDAAQQYQ